MSQFAIGVDYGTNSVRALVVDLSNGAEIASATFDYQHGEDGILLSSKDPNLARQSPLDYILGFQRSVAGAVILAKKYDRFDPKLVVGIGIDTTGSTPIPVNEEGVALGTLDEFKDDLAAQAWLWKDHTSHAEAAEITQAAMDQNMPGGTYSSEWYWAKILRCMRTSPRIAKATHSWVELADFVPALVTGNTNPDTMARSICAAGHKAMYHADWGGLPSDAFLESIEPGLSRFRYSAVAVPSNHKAGELTAGFADQVGLPAGSPVAVGAFDAHMGAVGAGVSAGTLVKIIGTSTCDCMVSPLEESFPDIPGLCGVVPESILPGMIGIEAGQSAVGDIFNWFVKNLTPEKYGTGDEAHLQLTEAAAKLRPGESGLLSLDWNNGNRSVLVDPLLTGLLVGQTLHTTAAEVYRALIEATAFGSLTIIRRVEEYGVAVDRVVNCGGIAEKSPFVMQIYADICNRPMHVSRSSQTCALGAAIFGAVVGGAYPSVEQAQAAMTGIKEKTYEPMSENVKTYEQLFTLYEQLHDAFGTENSQASLFTVMKELIAIRDLVRN